MKDNENFSNIYEIVDFQDFLFLLIFKKILTIMTSFSTIFMIFLTIFFLFQLILLKI